MERINLDNIKKAHRRIQKFVRKTPVLSCSNLRNPLKNNHNLCLKLECHQVTGSFKVRGALNKLLSLPPSQQKAPLFAASGGNHGLAVAYAGYTKGLPTKIYLPETTDLVKIQKIKRWGAEVVLAGTDIKQAIEAAHQDAKLERATYIHPFSDEDVILGQGTLGLDIYDDLKAVDLVVLAIGGGGLIGGVGTALNALMPKARIVGVEPETYPTLTKSLEVGKPVLLEQAPTVAVTLAVRQTSPLNLALVQSVVDETVLVTEDEIKQGTQWLWDEYSIAAEYSGAAALAALVAGKVTLKEGEKACVVICGAGKDGG